MMGPQALCVLFVIGMCVNVMAVSPLDNMGDTKSSILELVEQILTEQDTASQPHHQANDGPSDENQLLMSIKALSQHHSESADQGNLDVMTSRAIRELLLRFEDEIKAQLRDRNPEALHVAWNTTIQTLENELNSTQSQLSTSHEHLNDLRDLLFDLGLKSEESSAQLTGLEARQSKLHSRYLALRDKLKNELSNHLEPGVAAASAIRDHVTSIFENIPDFNSRLNAMNFLDVKSSVEMLTQLSNKIKDNAETSTSITFTLLDLSSNLHESVNTTEIETALNDQFQNVLHIPAHISFQENPLSHFYEAIGFRISNNSVGHTSESLSQCAQDCLDSSTCSVFSFDTLHHICTMQHNRLSESDHVIGSSSVHVLRISSNQFTDTAAAINGRDSVVINREQSDSIDQCITRCIDNSECFAITFDISSTCTLRTSPVNITSQARQLTLSRIGKRIDVTITLENRIDEQLTILCSPDFLNSIFERHSLTTQITSINDVVGPLSRGLCSRAGDSKFIDAFVEHSLQPISDLTALIRSHDRPALSISFQLTLPLEYDPFFLARNRDIITLAVADVCDIDQHDVTIGAVNEGIILDLSVVTDDSNLENMSQRIVTAVTSGEFATSFSSHGMLVGWTGLFQTPRISYDCADAFVPSHGRFQCDPNTITSQSSQFPIQWPCSCAHFAATQGMTHFTFDPRSGSCRTFRPTVEIESVDSWFESSCNVTIDGDYVHEFSGQILNGYVNQFERTADHRLTGAGVQHRLNEQDPDCCARQCLQREWCVSFVWDNVNMVCDLHNLTSKNNFTSLVAKTGRDYYERAGYVVHEMNSATAESHLIQLSSALVDGLQQNIISLNKLMAEKDAEHEALMLSLTSQIQNLTAFAQSVTNQISQTEESIHTLENDITVLTQRESQQITSLSSNMTARDTELAAADGNMAHWEEELRTIAQLRELLESLLTIETDQRSRALAWLRTREDLGNSTSLFRPFHDRPDSLYTASGEPRNRVTPDGSRLTGSISCTSESRSVYYSVMAERNVTYKFELFLKGYTLTDAVMLLRDAPGLKIRSDQLDYEPQTPTQGISNPQDLWPYARLEWECEETGWYVLQVTSFTDSACGTFGLSVDSSAPPFWLVIDGKKQDSSIACDSRTSPQYNSTSSQGEGGVLVNNTSVFKFDGVMGVTYDITAFTRDQVYTLPGVAMFLRDTSDTVNMASTNLQDFTTSQGTLVNSKIRWTCPHSATYEITITSTDGTQCGTFGIEIETLDACLRHPCPRGTRCIEATTPGEFLCVQDSSQVPEPGQSFGCDFTLWLNTPHTSQFDNTTTITTITSLLTSTIHSKLHTTSPSITSHLISSREQSGGTILVLAIQASTAQMSRDVSDVVRGVVVDGVIGDVWERNGVINNGVWLIAAGIRDTEPIYRTFSVIAKIDFFGISDVALQSPSVQIPIRIAIATAIHGVTFEQTRITSITPTTPTPPTTSTTTTLLQYNTLLSQLTFNITANTTDTGVDIAKNLLGADLVERVNGELKMAGLTVRCGDVRVVSMSGDDLQNNPCSWSDQCSACNEYRTSHDTWATLLSLQPQQQQQQQQQINCNWNEANRVCGASDGVNVYVCRRGPETIPFVSSQPQSLITFNITTHTPPQPISIHSQIAKATLWTTHIIDPSRIFVSELSGASTANGQYSVLMTVIIGADSRQSAVEIMRLIDSSVLEGGFRNAMTGLIDVVSVRLVASRLTSSAQTGLNLMDPNTAAAQPLHQKCDRVVVDTGGCDDYFHFQSPYANHPSTTLDTPDGTTDVPKACDQPESQSNIRPPNGRTGSVIFLDSQVVDVERSVPHIISALPPAASPHTGIALSHTPQQWQAALQDKSLLIFPKLHGPIHGPSFSPSLVQVIKQFLEDGGAVVVTGTPLRSVSMMNRVFGWELDDVSPRDGGVAFVPGTIMIDIAGNHNSSHTLTSCSATWTNQNAFNFVSRGTLPSNAREIFLGSDTSHNKIAAFDVPIESAGHVMYFGFDFYEAPSSRTVCGFQTALQYMFE